MLGSYLQAQQSIVNVSDVNLGLHMDLLTVGAGPVSDPVSCHQISSLAGPGWRGKQEEGFVRVGMERKEGVGNATGMESQ